MRVKRILKSFSKALRPVTYRLYFAFFWLLSLLPFSVLYLLSDIISPFVRRFYRRGVVRKNLAESFPGRPSSELKSIEKEFYRQLCDYFMETIKQFSMSERSMMKRMSFSGLEWVEEGFKSGGKDFLFVFLGHYGNWEWIASLQYWVPYARCTQIYHPLYNKVWNRIFMRLRQQYGGECIPMKKTLRRLLEIKQSGDKVVVGFISDQLPKWNGIHHFVPFLNHDTAVFTGMEQIGKKLGAMVVYARVTRPRRGYYHCEFVPVTDEPKEYADYDITDACMKLLEEDIEAHPYLWLWTHKRWRRTKEQWLERNGLKPDSEPAR